MIKAQNPGKLGKKIFLRFYSRNNVADRCWLNNLLYRVAQLLLFFSFTFELFVKKKASKCFTTTLAIVTARIRAKVSAIFATGSKTL